MIQERQFIASIVVGFAILVLIIRLVQKRRLDIAYCWVWLAIGVGMVLVVTQYEALTSLSRLVGAKTHTTTLFLLGFIVILLLCLQFSLALSSHRRQLRKTIQETAILRQELSAQRNRTPSGCARNDDQTGETPEEQDEPDAT